METTSGSLIILIRMRPSGITGGRFRKAKDISGTNTAM